MWVTILLLGVSGQLLNIQVSMQIPYAGCENVGMDITNLPISTVPFEHVASFNMTGNGAFACENMLQLWWTTTTETMSFFLVRNYSSTFSANCSSDRASLSPCTMYVDPSISYTWVMNPLAVNPVCQMGERLVLSSPRNVTGPPSLDVILQTSAVSSQGSCSGSVNLYYLNPQTSIFASLLRGSLTCDRAYYQYSPNADGNLTHTFQDKNTPPAWFFNCTTLTTPNAVCDMALNLSIPNFYQSYSATITRYGGITTTVQDGMCQPSSSPTSLTPTSASIPTASTPTLSPILPTVRPTKNDTLSAGRNNAPEIGLLVLFVFGVAM